MLAKEKRKEYSSLTRYQHTLGHVQCPACAAVKDVVMHSGFSDSLTFSAACQLWIDSRTIAGNARTCYVKPRTLKDFGQYQRALERFYGALTLKDIHIGHLREYQRLRATGQLANPEYPCEEVGPHKINQELGMLVRILKRAHAWTGEMEEFYEPLQTIESDVPRALNPHEQERFLSTASSRQEWQLVYCYALLALDTTASGCEMRGIKLGDLNLHERFLMIRSTHAKNKYRIRTVPLSQDALWAAAQLFRFAEEKGSRDPSHYLFPLRLVRGEWDCHQPMSNSGIKKPWDDVRKAAGLPHFKPHDTRHTAITRLAEAGTPIPVIMSMAGHISRKMLLHYTHISDQSKRLAVEAAFGRRPVHSFPQPVKKSASV